MSTATPNYGFILPAVNDPTDQDLWGGELNTNFISQDTLIKIATDWVISSKTANYTVLTSDRNTLFLIDATSGAVTLTLPAVASAGLGFSLAIKKVDSTSNTVTVKGNASELIDAANTFVITKQYDDCSIVANSTTWSVLSSKTTPNPSVIPNIITITSTGTYTPSNGMTYVIVEGVGAGGGGGGAGAGANSNTGAGGGGGGYFRKLLNATTVGTSQAVTIGVGGSGGSSVGGTGGVGGTTSFGTICSATGGAGGQQLNKGATGGVGSGGDFNSEGSDGDPGAPAPSTFGAAGSGGSSYFGGGGSGGADTTNAIGSNGNNYGGGGGGGHYTGAGATGGSGANGVIIITEYFI